MSNGWPEQTAGGFSFGCEDSLRESAVVGNTSDLTSRRMSHTVTTIAVAPVAGGILTASVAAMAAATGLGS